MKKRKHVMVTGGAGFIGSHVASQLVAEGYKVSIVDNLATGFEKNIPPEADFIKCDLGEKEEFKKISKLNCDALFHFAGQSSGEASFKDPYADLKSHLLSTCWLLEWCKQKNVKRFIYASSMSVYGDPVCLPVDENHPIFPKSFYAAGKISAETYIKLYQTMNINTTIFRLFSVYGPGQNMANKAQGMASIFLSYMLEEAPIIVKGSKKRFRDFIYIDDVVNAWLKAINNPASYGKVYNLGTGKKTKVEELINLLKKSFGDQNYPVLYKEEGTIGDQFGLFGNISKVTEDLKWKPLIDLSKGIDLMVNAEKNACRKKV